MCDKCECNEGYCVIDCTLGDKCSCEGCREILDFEFKFGETKVIYNKEEYIAVATTESDDEFIAKNNEGEIIIFLREDLHISDKVYIRDATKIDDYIVV